MPAPLVSALGYLLAPRAMGGLADYATRSRIDSLMSQGLTPEQIQSDPYLNALALVPRQSGVESTIDSLRSLSALRNTPLESPPQEEVRGDPYAILTRETPDGGVQFISPMDDFLRYGGRDADGRQDSGFSYGQTSEPAPEIRFDAPLINQETGEQYTLAANGGLMALMRGMYAQR